MLEVFLKPLEMTQAAAAQKLGMSTVRLNELVQGKRGVTADTAIRLVGLFKTTPAVLDAHAGELRFEGGIGAAAFDDTGDASVADKRWQIARRTSRAAGNGGQGPTATAAAMAVLTTCFP